MCYPVTLEAVEISADVEGRLRSDGVEVLLARIFPLGRGDGKARRDNAIL